MFPNREPRGSRKNTFPFPPALQTRLGNQRGGEVYQEHGLAVNGTDRGHNTQAEVPPCFGSHRSTVTDSTVKVPSLPAEGAEARPQPPTRRAERSKLLPQIRGASSASHGRKQVVTPAGTQNRSLVPYVNTKWRGSLVPYVNAKQSTGWTGKGHGPAFSRVLRTIVRPSGWS